MLGLIQKILFTMIGDHGGEAAIAAVKARAGVPADKYYEMCVAYPDEEWRRLYQAAAEFMNLPPDEVELEFSRYFIEDAARRWPMWFEMAHSSRDFLLLQIQIHNSFASGVIDPAARRGVEDKFLIESTPEQLIVHYRSDNRLCGLYKALAQRVADHYHDVVVLTETACLKRGDHECTIHVRFQEGALQ